jgi:hypothetical protein
VLKLLWLNRIARAAFFAALIFTFYGAVIPSGRGVARSGQKNIDM